MYICYSSVKYKSTLTGLCLYIYMISTTHLLWRFSCFVRKVWELCPFNIILYYRMDVPTLNAYLRPILTVTSVLYTGETGDIYCIWAPRLYSIKCPRRFVRQILKKLSIWNFFKLGPFINGVTQIDPKLVSHLFQWLLNLPSVTKVDTLSR